MTKSLGKRPYGTEGQANAFQIIQQGFRRRVTLAWVVRARSSDHFVNLEN